MLFGTKKKTALPSAVDALPGRKTPMQIDNRHYVNGNVIAPPFGKGLQQAMFGLGCFWGAERRFWQQDTIYSTAVGYAGGYTENPTYEEVCTGMTGHNEVVLVIFDAKDISYQELLRIFWGAHDPTQGMRQGNDVGTQYRSGIYFFNNEQKQLAEESKKKFQTALDKAGFSTIMTEIVKAPIFYYAETYHQQYLAKNPSGYCGLGGTGVSYCN